MRIAEKILQVMGQRSRSRSDARRNMVNSTDHEPLKEFEPWSTDELIRFSWDQRSQSYVYNSVNAVIATVETYLSCFGLHGFFFGLHILVRAVERSCKNLGLGSLQKQVSQLSQRDRAAGWVSYCQKWKTGTGRQYLRTI